MKCGMCGTLNPTQARFCMGCGYQLVQGLVCSTCHTLLPAHASYCTHCGTYCRRNDSEVSGGRQVAIQGSHVKDPAAAEAVTGRYDQPVQSTYKLPPDGALQIGQPVGERPIEAMLSSLQRYLPEALYEPLERRPKERDLQAVRDHLTALITTAKTYLPRPVVDTPQPPGIPAGGMRQGVFIFGDVSGFTPLSERLKVRGQAGAEQITGIINALFTELVKALFTHGGTLLKFGGDAMLGLWPVGTAAEMQDKALLACQTALALQEVLQRPEFSEIDAVGEKRALTIKIGISAGPYFAAHIGTQPSVKDQNGTMAYVTTGETVNLAEEAEGHAHPGQVAMTRAVAELVKDLVKLGPVEREPDDAYQRLLDVPPLDGSQKLPTAIPEPPEGTLLEQITYLVERLDRLTPYLSDELVSRIVTNPGDARITPEHRPVTVMFANYKGISKLIEKHGESDPELITHHLNNYFQHMASIVEKYEGTLARMDQYAVGDRIVIFFGAPRAHEDDPVRAVYTALEMQAAVKGNFAALRTSSGVFRFEQRIGINTGHLFAGNAGAPDLRQEYTLMGDDINMAARLMSNAPWGEIYMSKKTRDHVAAFIEVEDRGELKVKGKEIRIPTFSASKRRDEVGRTRGLESGESPLIGREEHLKQLTERGEVFLKGRGQITSLLGYSGLGKSRLLRELRAWLKAQTSDDTAEGQIQWIEARALSFTEEMGYWMAGQMLRGLLGLPQDAVQDDVLYTLGERGEALLGDEAMDAVPYLAHMMGLDLGEEWAWVKKEDAKVRQKQTLWAAAEFIEAAAREKPLVIALDDLHWADEASLTLFGHLLKIADHAPVMFCLLMRAQREQPSWKLRDRAASEFAHRYTEILLEPLSREESAVLLGELLPGAVFSTERKEDILDKAAGNPFYLEEVVRALIEAEAVIPDATNAGQWQVTVKISQITVPVTLHAAIVARIDRLTEDARQALQMASVIGRQFRMELLRSLSSAEAEIELWLAQLERGGLVHPSDISVDPLYAFPDALVQEVAYDSLLVLNRQQLHEQIGELFEEVYESALEQNCELLAYHFSRSTRHEKALKYLQMAAKKSEEKYANTTAIEYYKKILKIQQAENNLPGQAGALYAMGVKAYEIGDFENAHTWLEEAVRLRRVLEDAPNEGWSVMYLGMVNLKRANYTLAAAEHQYALDQARERGDRFQEGIHMTNLARVQMRKGQYAAAFTLFEESLALKKSNNDITGQAFALFYMGLTRIYQGGEDNLAQAESLLNDSIAMWQQVALNDRGLAYCNSGLGLLALQRKDYPLAAAFFDKAIASCTKLVLKAELVENLSYLGLALLGKGDSGGAREASERAVRMLADQQDVEEIQAIHFNHYLVLKAVKDPHAGKFLEHAHRIVQDQAERIEDAADRKVFLEETLINQMIARAG